jgi:hypothetical protein
VFAEQHDTWLVASRRYFSPGSMKAVQVGPVETEEMAPELAAAS